MKEEKPVPPPEQKKPKQEEPPAPEAPDGGQHTIFNTPPSRFERLVDEVLKKHKL
jgi:hypothetical protein